MYTLRLPFSLQDGKEIDVVEKSGDLDEKPFILKKQDRGYVFTISGFPTEESANKYINNVWSGFMWLLLHCNLSPNAIFESRRNVVYSQDPDEAAKNWVLKEPIDGVIDGNQPAIYLTGKNIRTLIANPVGITQTYPVDNILKFFCKGALFPSSNEIHNNPKLKIALELYGAFFTEFSANAKFLTLVLALETLIPDIPRTPLVIDLMDKWEKEATNQLICDT